MLSSRVIPDIEDRPRERTVTYLKISRLSCGQRLRSAKNCGACGAFLLSYFMVVVSSSFSEHVGPVLTNNLQSLALLKGPFEAPRMGVNTYHRIISYEHRMTCDYRG